MGFSEDEKRELQELIQKRRNSPMELAVLRGYARRQEDEERAKDSRKKWNAIKRKSKRGLLYAAVVAIGIGALALIGRNIDPRGIKIQEKLQIYEAQTERDYSAAHNALLSGSKERFYKAVGRIKEKYGLMSELVKGDNASSAQKERVRKNLEFLDSWEESHGD